MPPQMTLPRSNSDSLSEEESSINNNKPLKLVVLQAMMEGCVYEDDDSPADVASHFIRAGYDHVQVENVFLSPLNYAPELVKLAKRTDVDCFVNLCDGAWDEPSVGMQVVDLLETKLNVPFTGANMRAFEPSRLEMKTAALACSGSGVKVPAWRFVYTLADLETFLKEFDTTTTEESSSSNAPPLKFPLLAKHFSSYSSVGLIKDSKVWDVQGLRTQCTRMIETYGGCLVEEFIVGREFTVLACQVPSADDNNGVNVMAYEPVECRFKQGEDFKHYNLKWVDYEDLSWHPITDKDLSERLKQMAIDVFRSIRGRGYGRIDVRSDPSGENLYFLEINPNCGVFYPVGLYGSADFILDLKDPERAHADFCLAQVEVSRRLWQQQRNETSIFEARYDARKESWGLFALKDIQVGQVIRRYEEGAMHVVSKSHIMRHWRGAPNYIDAPKKAGDSALLLTEDDINLCWDNFQAYCWPLTDNLFAMWDPDPNKWQPINHSCDPNAWNQEGNGLDVVARRNIQANEEITMDYATFCGYFPDMKSFHCACGSKICRGTITGMDIVDHPELIQIYEGHMSDYVARKANETIRAEDK